MVKSLKLRYEFPFGFEPSDPSKALEYLEKAKKELGIEDISLNFLFSDSEGAKKIAVYIQEQLRRSLV